MANSIIMKNIVMVLALIGLIAGNLPAQDAKPPVRIAMVGLVHDHALGMLSKLNGRTDVQLAGIVETNEVLIARYTERFHLDTNLFFPSLAALLAHTNISAVAIFTSTFDHPRVVADCAAQAFAGGGEVVAHSSVHACHGLSPASWPRRRLTTMFHNNTNTEAPNKNAPIVEIKLSNPQPGRSG